ncbi:PTS sugar transporter subunit IIC, partial [Staphylococcus pseudintermedius]
NTMGASLNTWLLIMMFHFVLPAFVTFVIYRFMIKRQWLHVGEQKIQLNQ